MKASTESTYTQYDPDPRDACHSRDLIVRDRLEAAFRLMIDNLVNRRSDGSGS